MIVTIGIMVGFYIGTRMLHVLIDRKPHVIVAIAAVVTILVTGLCLVDLVMRSAAGGLPNLIQ